jgi:ubiquinone biosynthesis protein COQ4
LEDPTLGYVMTRYRESHDLVHATLGMPTTMLGEVAIKWIEAINTGLPMCLSGGIFGAFRLRPKHRQLYRQYYLPWAIENGRSMKPAITIYWEKRWDQDIDEFRKELNVKTLELPKK